MWPVFFLAKNERSLLLVAIRSWQIHLLRWPFIGTWQSGKWTNRQYFWFPLYSETASSDCRNEGTPHIECHPSLMFVHWNGWDIYVMYSEYLSLSEIGRMVGIKRWFFLLFLTLRLLLWWNKTDRLVSEVVPVGAILPCSDPWHAVPRNASLFETPQAQRGTGCWVNELECYWICHTGNWCLPWCSVSALFMLGDYGYRTQSWCWRPADVLH